MSASAMARPTGKIMVVDDQVALAENLAEILEDAGYEVVVADSAEAALARIAAGGAGEITALITDYRLPGLTGGELIAELRRRGNPIPAVVMSAYTDDETIETARAAGAAEVLPKPVPLDRLMKLAEAMGEGEAMVLLVEDNQALAENLIEVLRARGHRAAVCGSVAEAKRLATKPRAAVLDYRLPDGTGLEVAEQLLARDDRTKILFLSGYRGELEARLEGDLAASAERLDKPVDIERLLTWVAEALGRGAAERSRR